MSERRQNDGSDDMIKAAWQSQALEAPRISLELVRHHVDKLNADLREQTFLMYLGLVLLAGLLPFGLLRGSSSAYMLAGSLLALVGAIYVTLELRRRGSKLNTPVGGSIVQTLDAYRAELERRRDYYLDSWRWSIWPMVPSVLVFIVGGALYGTRPNAVRHSIWMGVFAVIVTLLAVWDHRRKGHAYQRELDAFETLNRE
jgi:hypothetical protein